MWPWNPSRVTSDPTKVTPSLVVPPTPEKPTVTQNITGKVVTVAIIAEHRLRREEEDRIAELVKLARAAEKEEKVREREELTIAKAAAKALREVNAAKKRADKAARLAAKRKTPDPAQAPTATLTPVLPVPAAQSARKRAKKSL